MTLSVSDPAQSLEWYQGLFGMPVAARQANTVILRVGAGPQFMAIGGGASSAPSINHLCLSTPGFSADDITTVLQRTVGRELDAGQLNLRIRMRDDEFGGAPEGTPELCVEDYDGIVLQLQDTAYCGGEGLLGETCLSTPEPAPSGGLLALRGLQPLHDLRHRPAADHRALSAAVRYGRSTPIRAPCRCSEWDRAARSSR